MAGCIAYDGGWYALYVQPIVTIPPCGGGGIYAVDVDLYRQARVTSSDVLCKCDRLNGLTCT